MDVTSEFFIAQTLGAVGFIAGLLAMWQKQDARLLVWMLLCNTLFMCHYIVLGAYFTAALISLVVIRLLLARYHPRDYWIYILSLVAVIQFLTLGQPIEVLMLTATLLGNVAYFKLRHISLRLVLILVQLLCVPVAYHFDAYFALAFNAASCLVAAIAIVRLLKDVDTACEAN